MKSPGKRLEPIADKYFNTDLINSDEIISTLPLHLPSEHKLERFLTVLAQKDAAPEPKIKPLVRFFSRCWEDRSGGVSGSRNSNFIRAEFIFKQPRGATAGHPSRVLP